MKNKEGFSDFLLRELYKAYYDARKGGKRRTIDEHCFEMNEMENLVRLRDSIIRRKYYPHRGVAFIVDKPVTREIFAAPFVDRVIHHFIYNHSAPWWDTRFLPCCYACRKGMGTLYGIKHLQHQMRRASQGGKVPAVVVKRDLRGYFMSLDHKKLYERVCWGLDHQFLERGPLYNTLKFLWGRIIFDNPKKGVKRRGSLQDWDRLPPDKSLFCQPKGRGIVIGNLTSQLLSNIFLSQLDHYIVRELGYKNYGRYVDDFFIVVPQTELGALLKDMEEINLFLDRLGLVLHPNKCKNIPVENGVDFLGARVFIDHIEIGKRLRHNCARTIRRIASTGKGKLESLTSYSGHTAYLDSHRFMAKAFRDVGWDYIFPKNFPKKR